MKVDLSIERFVEGLLEVNTYLLADLSHENRPAAIIDPGSKSMKIVRKIEKMHLNLKYIINTHGHIDHIGFNKWFKDKFDCELLIHEADAPWLGHKQDDYLFDILCADMSPLADKLLTDGDVIDIGHIKLEVLHTPGHTPGCICLRIDNIAFTGDTLFEGSIGRTDLPGGSFEQLMNSIKKKLLILPDETKIYPGHGEYSTIGEEKENNPFLQI